MRKLTYLKTMLFGLSLMLFGSCADRDYGASPYDPNTPITVSEMPTVLAFDPIEAATGETVRVEGKNFLTAKSVAFGGKYASSFTIESDNVILAVVSSYGGTGTVSVTNHKGTKSLPGFTFKKTIEVDEPNVALGKNATASSTFSEGTGPHAGVDGDDGTRWSADNAGNDHWFLVDLGSIIPINKAIIKWEGAFGADYTIQVSEDSETFSTVFTRTGFAFTADAPNDEMIFETINARYVKLVVTKAGTPWSLSFWEFEVHKYIPPVNLALNQPATASSKFSDGTGAQAGVDGDDATRWSADNAGNDHWFKVDLGGVKSVNNVAIIWEGAYGADYNIQVSSDDETYETVFTRTGFAFSPDAPKDVMMFDPVDARYVKLVVTKAATPWFLSFWEIEIYKI